MEELQPVHALDLDELVISYPVREASLKQVRASMETLGQLTPAVVVAHDDNLHLLDGAARVQVLRELGINKLVAYMPANAWELLANLRRSHQDAAGPVRPGQADVVFSHASRIRNRDLKYIRALPYRDRVQDPIDIREELTGILGLNSISEIQILQTLRNAAGSGTGAWRQAVTIIQDLMDEKITYHTARQQYRKAQKATRNRMSLADQHKLLGGVANGLVVMSKSLSTLPPDLDAGMERTSLRMILREMEEARTVLVHTINKVRKTISQEDPQ